VTKHDEELDEIRTELANLIRRAQNLRLRVNAIQRRGGGGPTPRGTVTMAILQIASEGLVSAQSLRDQLPDDRDWKNLLPGMKRSGYLEQVDRGLYQITPDGRMWLAKMRGEG
jgi:hypothetical protein